MRALGIFFHQRQLTPSLDSIVLDSSPPSPSDLEYTFPSVIYLMSRSEIEIGQASPSKSSYPPTHAEVVPDSSSVSDLGSSVASSPSDALGHPRDLAASKHGFVVFYISVPDDISSVRVGEIRKRLKPYDLPNPSNLSILGVKYVEVVLKFDQFANWNARAGQLFPRVPDLDPLSPDDMRSVYPLASSYGQLHGILVARLRKQIKSVRDKRVEKFYKEWLESLSPSQPLSTPPVL